MSGINTPFPEDNSSNFPALGEKTPQKKATPQQKSQKVKESLTPDTETKKEIKDILVTQEPKSPEETKLVQEVATPILLEASETKATLSGSKYPKLEKPVKNLMPEDRDEATSILAHIHADEFGRGSELEGFDSTKTLGFLGNFLDSLPQSHKKAYGIEDTIDLFNESILLNEDLDPTDIGIEALQRPLDAGREVLLIGGWTSSTKLKGHTMYYQLIPETSGKVTMRIFNLGNGRLTHYSAFVGNKEKSYPFVEWGGIDKSKILSKDFLGAIKELRTETHFGPDKKTDTSYGSEDIYRGLRDFLSPEKITLFPGESGIQLLMTPQRAGFCSWRGLMAFLRSKMDKEAYKHLKLQLKLQSLISYIDNKPSGHIDPKELRLVNKSFQKLCRSLDKLHEQGLVDEAYLNSAYDLLLPVKSWLKVNKAEMVSEKDIQEIEENAFGGKLKDLPGEPALFSINAEEIPLDKISIETSQEIQSLTFTEPVIFHESLRKALENTTQDWKDGNDISAHANLLNLIDKLPKDQAFWTLACGKDPEKAKELIVELGNLQQLFFSTCFTIPQAQARSPEKLVAATKLLYLQTQLLQYVSPLLADVKPQLGLVDKFLSKKSDSFSDEYLYFHSFDGKKDREIQELFLWLSANSEHTSNPKFDYKTSYTSNATLNYEFKFPYDNLTKESFLDHFRQIDEAFHSQNYLPKHQQEARLYSSDKLPEWFKSLRDGTVFTHILMNENLGLIQETKNSRELLKPVFKVSDNKRDESTVTLMIDGIDWVRVRHGQNGKSPLGLYAPFDKKYDDFCTSLKFSMQNATETSLSSNDDLGGSDKTKRDLEELRNIFYCTLEPELTLQSTLELFSRHPEYLLNPNYQMFFQMFMFQVGYMNKAVELPGFKENLVQFLEKNITNFRLNNEFPAAIFLIRMARYSSNYFEHPSLDNLSLLRDMGSTEEIPPSIKSLIYNELLCALGKKEPGELERKDVEDIFKAMSYTQRYPVGARETDFFIKNDIQKSFLKHSFQLTKALSDQDEIDYLINLAVKEAFPEEPYLEWQNTTRDEALPVFTAVDGRCEYYPTSGRIIFPGKIGLLPDYLKEDATFKKMFPQISEATQLTGDIYSFRDSFGVETRVRKKRDGDELIIEQLRGDDYVRHVNPAIFLKTKKDDEDQKVSRLQSRFLVDNFDHWISEKNYEDKKTLSWVNPHNGEIIYIASVEADDDKPQIENIVRVADKAVLNTTSQAFNFFEDEQFIHEWFLDGNLVEVEFPRYAITLKPDSTGKLASSEFPGFYLKPEVKIKSLGAYKHYMVLENASGEKKVLLPQIHFKEPKKLKEVFEPRYEVKWDQDSSEPKSRKILTFDVLSNGKLSSKSRAANLYLAEVALLMQDYKNAGKYLREFGTKLEAYTPEELEILNQIANLEDVTGDNSGNAWAVRTYAGYLLIKNSEDFVREGKTKKKEIKLDISSSYTKYISHYRNVTDLKLTRDEELYLVRRIRKNITTQEIEARFLELTGVDTSSRKHIIPEKIEGELNPSVSTLMFDIGALSEIFSYSSYSYNRGVKPSDFPMTRIFDADDGLSLSNGYKFARNADPSNDEERNLLRQAIPWANRTHKENKHKIPLLKLILDQPERFPEMPSNFESLKSEERKEFWKKVLEVANILASEGSIVWYESTAHKPLTVDLTPQSFKLDSQKKSSYNESAKAATSSQAASLKNLAEFPEIAKLFTSSETPRFKPVDISLSSMNTDPLVHKEVKRLANDAVGLARQNPPLTYSIANPEQLSNPDKILKDISDVAKLELNVLEAQILKLARKQPVTSSARALSSIQTWGGKQKPLKLGELIVNFGKQDPDQLMTRNPALSSKDVEALYSKLGEYLQIATRQQQAKRALSTIGKREEAVAMGDSKAIEELTQQLASDLLATRSYNHANQPAFLVFEYFADILMRKKQVDMIDAFLKGKETNPMMEMIMGSGKSKVLLPLLGLLRAQPENLSMLIVPDPLFGSVSSDTQKILGEAFYVSLHTLDFDRNTPLNEGHLENILEELKSIQKNKECLILTSKSISCMVLKYIEQASIEFQESKGTKEMSNELKLLREILGIFSKSGNPLLDEADLLLNALHEVSFSLGDAHSPRQEESDLITHIYDTIYTNQEVRKLVSIESDPSPNVFAPALTEQNYETIKHPLSHILIESFKTIIMENKPLEAVIRNYFSDLSERDKTLVLHYLNRDEEFIGVAQRFYNSQPKEIQEFLSLAGEELNSTLPHTLTRNCNEKYGLDDSGVVAIAIPYSAATVPSYGSQFANHHVTMNYTIQAYVKQNISKKVLEIEIRRLQKSARQEIQDSESVKTLENTEAWKVFNEIKGDLNIPLFNMNDKQLNILLTSVNADTQKKLNLIKKIILPQIIVHDKKISINPINLLSFLPWASGFTGTLWNSASMHRKISPIPAEGTDALTISLLAQHSQDKIHTIDRSTPANMLDEIQSFGIPFSLLADAGGYFKDENNFENAKLLQITTGKPVVFYNEFGQQTIWDGSKTTPFAESKLKEDERITYLDQSHTTGADVKQKLDAVGYVTIGDKMLLRDLLQAVWRLRGLEKSQRVEFILAKDVEAVIRQTLNIGDSKITFQEILKFVIHNQANQQGKENFMAFNQELDDLSQHILLSILLDPNSSPQDSEEALKTLGSTWIKPMNESAGTLYGTISKKTDSAEVCKTKAEAVKASLKKITNKEAETALQGVDQIVKRYQTCLPEKVMTRVGNEDMTVEMEQKKSVEVEKELEFVNQSLNKGGTLGEMTIGSNAPILNSVSVISDEIFKDWGKYNNLYNAYASALGDKQDGMNVVVPPKPTFDLPIPVLSVSQWMAMSDDLKDYAGAFKGIEFSLNMFQWPSKDPKASDLQLFGPHSKPIHYMNVEAGRITVLNSAEAAAHMRHDMNKALYNRTTGFCVSGKSLESADQVQFENLIKIKFLSGESNYKPDELKFLEFWLKANNSNKMYNLFREKILSGHLLKQDEYLDSSLQRLFKKLNIGENETESSQSTSLDLMNKRKQEDYEHA